MIADKYPPELKLSPSYSFALTHFPGIIEFICINSYIEKHVPKHCKDASHSLEYDRSMEKSVCKKTKNWRL